MSAGSRVNGRSSVGKHRHVLRIARRLEGETFCFETALENHHSHPATTPHHPKRNQETRPTQTCPRPGRPTQGPGAPADLDRSTRPTTEFASSPLQNWSGADGRPFCASQYPNSCEPGGGPNTKCPLMLCACILRPLTSALRCPEQYKYFKSIDGPHALRRDTPTATSPRSLA
jgi:hypothetical protein